VDFADYRGLSARVRVDPETGKATEISWYISGKVEMVFTRQSCRGCDKANRDKGDRSPDRFRGEMESCGDPVSAWAFPQAMKTP